MKLNMCAACGSTDSLQQRAVFPDIDQKWEENITLCEMCALAARDHELDMIEAVEELNASVEGLGIRLRVRWSDPLGQTAREEADWTDEDSRKRWEELISLADECNEASDKQMLEEVNEQLKALRGFFNRPDEMLYPTTSADNEAA
jgi:hypothetical protein